jgi:hypothetical protein
MSAPIKLAALCSLLLATACGVLFPRRGLDAQHRLDTWCALHAVQLWGRPEARAEMVTAGAKAHIRVTFARDSMFCRGEWVQWAP